MSVLASLESSDGRKRRPRPEVSPQFDCVRSINETAAILGIGEPSLRVMVRNGVGPKVTRLSKRRIGIRDSHRQAWLDSKVEGAAQ